MYKLVILIDQLEDWNAFEAAWPQFLHAAEQMPGLLREATSHVETILYGKPPVALVHELFFESQKEAQDAMASSAGREAGRVLQAMTRGRLALFFADHKEDNLENIRKHTQTDGD